jgi:hypothetical protein
MLFAGTFPKSFSFPMNVYERIYILLAFHAFTPAENSTLPDKRIGSPSSQRTSNSPSGSSVVIRGDSE